MEILLYLLKSSLLLAIFLLCYRFLLAKETFYTFNRYFLTVGLVSALCLPSVIFTRSVSVASLDFSQLSLAEMANQEASTITQTSAFDLWELGLIVYGLGVLVFSIYFIYQLITLFISLKKQDFYIENGLIYVEISGISAPFSFLKYIVYDPQAHTAEELQMILQHERAHATQLHSLDILLGRFCCVALWFNPFCWLYFRAMEENLEFLADSCVENKLFSSKSYQLTLLRNATGTKVPQFTQSFYKSFIKKRIIMLNTTKSQSRNRYKVLVLLPFLAAFLWSFNVREVSRILPENNTLTSIAKYPAFMLSEHSTNSQIKEITTYFKEQIPALNVDISVQKRDYNGNIVMFDFLTQFSGDNHFAERFARNKEGSFEPYRIQYLGDGKLMVTELGDSGQHFIITKDKLQIMKAEKETISTKKSAQMAENLQDKAFRFEIAPKTTETEIEAMVAQLKDDYNVQLKYSSLRYNDKGIITAVALEMKDLRNKNVSKFNLKNTEGLGTIVLFRSEQGTLGFTSGMTSNSTSTQSKTSTRTSLITSGDSSTVSTTTSLEAQEKALEMQQAALEEQRKALERQRTVLDEQRERLENQREEMTKALEEQQEAMEKISVINHNTTTEDDKSKDKLDDNVLYLVDGEEISKEKMNTIKPEEIESINVIKDSKSLKKYGDKAKNGVVEIKLKKDNKE